MKTIMKYWFSNSLYILNQPFLQKRMLMIIASAVRKFLVGYRYRIIIIKVHISIRVKKLHRNFPVLTFMMYNDYTFRNVFERVIALNCCKIYAPKISHYHISFALTKRVFISRMYAVFWLKLLICMYSKPDKFCLLYLIFASCFSCEFCILSLFCYT